MNKKLTAFFTQYGLNVTGNIAYGALNGYETSVHFSAPFETSACYVHVSFYATPEQRQSIAASVMQLGLKGLMATTTLYGISFIYSVVLTGTLIKNLPVLFDRLTELLKQAEIPGSDTCPYCGKPLDPQNLKRCQINGFTVTLDADCVSTINQQIAADNAAFANQPNNYIQGICGALIGGVIGAACVLALYFAGYVAAISSIVAVLLGAFLYRKLGGKANVMMIVIVSVISLAFICLGYFLAVLIDISATLGCSMSVAFETLSAAMKLDQEVSGSFYSGLAMQIVFGVIGIVLVVVSLVKTIKRPKSI